MGWTIAHFHFLEDENSSASAYYLYHLFRANMLLMFRFIFAKMTFETFCRLTYFQGLLLEEA